MDRIPASAWLPRLAGGRAGALWIWMRCGRAAPRRAGAEHGGRALVGPPLVAALRRGAGFVAGVARGAARAADRAGVWPGDRAQPVWMTPTFTLTSMVSFALAAVHRDDGIAEPAGCGGLASGWVPNAGVDALSLATGWRPRLLAPFGGYALNLSRHHRRHLQGPAGARRRGQALHRRRCAAGCSTSLIGLVGRAVVGVLPALPRELVLAIAGPGLDRHHRRRFGPSLARRGAPRRRRLDLLGHLVRRDGAGRGVGLLGVVAAASRWLCNSCGLQGLTHAPDPRPGATSSHPICGAPASLNLTR